MSDLSMPLSKNFTLGEFLRSGTAERIPALKSEQENPPQNIVENLKYLVEKTLQPVRDEIGAPIRINSGYRCPSVNKLVGGSSTSQHCLGEAADCEISRNFLSMPEFEPIRANIRSGVMDLTGKPLKDDISENLFLFALICLNLEKLDIDQVIHEYGTDFGDPAWVHVASSNRQNRRQILFVGQYTDGKYLKPSVEEALAYLT
ncbi:MAG: hypothetical protein JSW64_13005 [Candidatus Zixiibacteriota bacterium]|nr:MAG: hypothetical protein JSW64_13005 [candidate division Zixibacteria bacterium]